MIILGSRPKEKVEKFLYKYVVGKTVLVNIFFLIASVLMV